MPITNDVDLNTIRLLIEANDTTDNVLVAMDEEGTHGWNAVNFGGILEQGPMLRTGGGSVDYNNPFEARSIEYKVTAGQYVRAGSKIYFNHTAPYYFRVGFEFLNSAGSVVSRYWTAYTTGYSTPTTIRTAVATAPATAVKVRMVVALYRLVNGVYEDRFISGGSTWTNVSVVFSENELLISNSTLTTTTYVPPVNYTNITTSATSISIKRREMEVGTMKAVVRDAALDPANSNTVRPGKRVRVQALKVLGGTDWQTLFQGSVNRAETTYEDDGTTTISIDAVDAFAQFVSLPADGVRHGGGGLPVVPEGIPEAGIPIYVDNTSYDTGRVVGRTPKNQYYRYYPERLTALEAVGLARDTYKGLVFVDRKGNLRIYTGTAGSPIDSISPPVEFYAKEYSDLDVSFDTTALVNVINIKTVQTVLRDEDVSFTDAAGTTRNFVAQVPVDIENKYQFSDDASVNEWGPRTADFILLEPYVTSYTDPTGTGNPLVPTAWEYSLEQWAKDIFTLRAIPKVALSKLSFPVKDAASRVRGCTVDIWSSGRVPYKADGSVPYHRVRGVEHNIRPGKWTVTLDFTRPSDGVLW